MPDPDPNLMTIFAEALERRDPAARAAYLDEACKSDVALRQRVEALLAAHDRAGGFLEPGSAEMSETTGSDPLQSTLASVPETQTASELATGETRLEVPATLTTAAGNERWAVGSAAGQIIAGRFKLLDVLGEGGMGTVYRADQTEPVKRQVALKVIKVGLDSRAVLARFDAERQALALMDHPNIARVYDGGTTAAGQPFFVMELVNGVPITDYCDRHRLSVRSRLELFVSVCQAVQHAHQKGIIHRDLKPSNVLVTDLDGRPAPKVIDFGVAKATEIKLTDQSFADSGAIVGTPIYMSPEQADPSSMDIDTRTDVYALGVILYELLAGSPPIDAKQFRRGAFLEMLRMVREIDPPRPSTKVSTAEALPNIAASRDTEPGQLKRALRGDLDWIVMKALEKDRGRRYETANGFAADVLRHLSHEPVQAAPPSRAYRVRKFVLKHRSSVVAAGLVVLALLAGIAGTTLGLIRAERARVAEAKRVQERDAALAKADQARRTADTRAEELKYQLGVSDFLLASAAYDDGNVRLSAERLEEVPEAQRGWEWRYLKRLTPGGLFTLYGHRGVVSSASFSADGTRIVTGSWDNTAKVWDARTGMPILELKGHTGGVSSASFSPDTTRIVTGSSDSTVKVWDARTGTIRLDLKGHSGAVHGASFSADGARVVAGGSDGTAKVWDARSGTLLLDLKGQARDVRAVSFAPEGTRIVTCGYGAMTRVWDARTGSPNLDLKDSALNTVSFSPDGTRIVTDSGYASAKVWDATTGTGVLNLVGHSGHVQSASFSPDGTRIVTASSDGTAKVWDARTGTPLLDLKSDTHQVGTASFSPDGTRIVTGGSDGTAKVWDALTPAPAVDLKGRARRVGDASFKADNTQVVAYHVDDTTNLWGTGARTPAIDLKGHTEIVSSASFSADGKRVVTGSWDGTARVWDARTATPLLVLIGQKYSRVRSVAFSPDSTRIVSGSWAGEAKVWDARTGTPMFELKGHTWDVRCVAVSPDGTRIATASDDHTAKVWDARTGTLLLDLKGGVRTVSFSPDGAWIVTGSDDQTARIWNALTGAPRLELKGHSHMAQSVSFSPDGTQIVTSGKAGEAKLWDARTGTALIDLRGHTGEVRGVAFSPDGTRIVTGSTDGTAKVWDARTGTPMLELRGHAGGISSASFSRDGTRVVTSSFDRTAKVWDAGPIRHTRLLKGHAAEVSSASFSPDGTRVVTSSEDNTAKVWDVQTGAALLELKGHTSGLTGVSFNPNGTRIATVSSDQTAKVWDAVTGIALLDLKGCTGFLGGVSFTPDGSRIVIGSVSAAQMWDARTGQELKGKPIPPIPAAGLISPDGRWFALPIGKYIELIATHPDEQELADRRFLMQPNFRLYREAYDAAIKANDAFAARFYLNLFPPPERPLIQASTEIQIASLKRTGMWPESPEQYNNSGWALVRDPGRSEADFQLGVRLARAACRLEPDNVSFRNTLGVAQYRCGLTVEALATLTRSNDRNQQKQPADLAFLALAQHRLGLSEKARDTLLKLRAVMKDPQRTVDQEAQAFLREAETIELDRFFPVDPFAR